MVVTHKIMPECLSKYIEIIFLGRVIKPSSGAGALDPGPTWEVYASDGGGGGAWRARRRGGGLVHRAVGAQVGS